MAVPHYADLTIPILHFCSDGQVHVLEDLKKHLSDIMELTQEDLSERLRGGRVTRFSNTVTWAVSHLKAASLLDKAEGKAFRITDDGLKLLENPPDRLDISFMRTIPAYMESLNKGKEKKTVADGKKTSENTPEEDLDSAYESISIRLRAELHEQMMASAPDFFEQLVVDLLIKMNYGGTREEAGQKLGRSGDEGVDGLIKGDPLGFDEIYVQAKRWKDNVGRPEIQKFVGALHGKHAKQGVFITTSSFSAGAREYVQHLDSKVILVDGPELTDFMLTYGLGVTEERSYTIYRIDTDYFSSE